MNRRIVLAAGFLILFVASQGAFARDFRLNEDPPLSCLKCHGKQLKWNDWLHSAHHKVGLTCTDCHSGVTTKHTAKTVKTKSCTSCHYWWKNKQKDLSASIHGKKGLTCASCHNPHKDVSMIPHTMQEWQGRCGSCHKGDPLKWHSFMPKAKIHLYQHSCIVCHGDVHKITGKSNSTVTCSNCHPKGSGVIKYAIPKHTFLPHVERHLDNIKCEVCHKPSGPTKNCTACHSSHTILEMAPMSGAFTNSYVQKEYGYVVGANHLKWLDILGLLLFGGSFAVWIVHGGLRLLLGGSKKGKGGEDE